MIVYIYGLWDSRTCELKYIGRTNNLYMRFAAHISEAATRKGYNPRKEKWTRDLLREGLEPVLEVLEECDEYNHEEIERAWIAEAKAKGAKLFNISEGGNGWLYGKDHPMHGKFGAEHHSFGFRHTEESKRKMSEAQKKRPSMSDENRRKTSERLKGTKRSDEDRRKMSEGRMGCKVKPFTEEHKAKISQAHKGKKGPKQKEETKIKRGLAISMTNAIKRGDIVRVRQLQSEHFLAFGFYNQKHGHHFC